MSLRYTNRALSKQVSIEQGILKISESKQGLFLPGTPTSTYQGANNLLPPPPPIVDNPIPIKPIPPRPDTGVLFLLNTPYLPVMAGYYNDGTFSKDETIHLIIQPPKLEGFPYTGRTFPMERPLNGDFEADGSIEGWYVKWFNTNGVLRCPHGNVRPSVLDPNKAFVTIIRKPETLSTFFDFGFGGYNSGFQMFYNNSFQVDNYEYSIETQELTFINSERVTGSCGSFTPNGIRHDGYIINGIYPSDYINGNFVRKKIAEDGSPSFRPGTDPFDFGQYVSDRQPRSLKFDSLVFTNQPYLIENPASTTYADALIVTNNNPFAIFKNVHIAALPSGFGVELQTDIMNPGTCILDYIPMRHLGSTGTYLKIQGIGEGQHGEMISDGTGIPVTRTYRSSSLNPIQPNHSGSFPVDETEFSFETEISSTQKTTVKPATYTIDIERVTNLAVTDPNSVLVSAVIDFGDDTGANSYPVTIDFINSTLMSEYSNIESLVIDGNTPTPFASKTTADLFAGLPYHMASGDIKLNIGYDAAIVQEPSISVLPYTAQLCGGDSCDSNNWVTKLDVGGYVGIVIATRKMENYAQETILNSSGSGAWNVQLLNQEISMPWSHNVDITYEIKDFSLQRRNTSFSYGECIQDGVCNMITDKTEPELLALPNNGGGGLFFFYSDLLANIRYNDDLGNSTYPTSSVNITDFREFGIIYEHGRVYPGGSIEYDIDYTSEIGKDVLHPTTGKELSHIKVSWSGIGSLEIGNSTNLFKFNNNVNDDGTDTWGYFPEDLRLFNTSGFECSVIPFDAEIANTLLTCNFEAQSSVVRYHGNFTCVYQYNTASTTFNTDLRGVIGNTFLPIADTGKGVFNITGIANSGNSNESSMFTPIADSVSDTPFGVGRCNSGFYPAFSITPDGIARQSPVDFAAHITSNSSTEQMIVRVGASASDVSGTEYEIEEVGSYCEFGLPIENFNMQVGLNADYNIITNGINQLRTDILAALDEDEVVAISLIRGDLVTNNKINLAEYTNPGLIQSGYTKVKDSIDHRKVLDYQALPSTFKDSLNVGAPHLSDDYGVVKTFEALENAYFEIVIADDNFKNQFLVLECTMTDYEIWSAMDGIDTATYTRTNQEGFVIGDSTYATGQSDETQFNMALVLDHGAFLQPINISVPNETASPRIDTYINEDLAEDYDHFIESELQNNGERNIQNFNLQQFMTLPSILCCDHRTNSPISEAPFTPLRHEPYYQTFTSNNDLKGAYTNYDIFERFNLFGGGANEWSGANSSEALDTTANQSQVISIPVQSRTNRDLQGGFYSPAQFVPLNKATFAVTGVRTEKGYVGVRHTELTEISTSTSIQVSIVTPDNLNRIMVSQYPYFSDMRGHIHEFEPGFYTYISDAIGDRQPEIFQAKRPENPEEIDENTQYEEFGINWYGYMDGIYFDTADNTFKRSKKSTILITKIEEQTRENVGAVVNTPWGSDRWQSYMNSVGFFPTTIPDYVIFKPDPPIEE